MTLSVLDLFVLSMLDRGCETPYDLQRQAGLSLGGTVPALRRLAKAGLLTLVDGDTGTKRPRHHYRLTASGKDKARKGWKERLSGAKIPADLDSILRLVDLAAHYRAPKKQIVTFLKQASQSRQRLVDEANLALAHRGRTAASSYVALRLSLDIERFAAEASVLARIAAGFKNSMSAHPDNEHLAGL
jgi:DNA-binding PadR family transcriptional regulator